MKGGQQLQRPVAETCIGNGRREAGENASSITQLTPHISRQATADFSDSLHDGLGDVWIGRFRGYVRPANHAQASAADRRAGGSSGTFETPFVEGNTYVAVCYIQDREGGPPHAIEHQMFDVLWPAPADTIGALGESVVTRACSHDVGHAQRGEVGGELVRDRWRSLTISVADFALVTRPASVAVLHVEWQRSCLVRFGIGVAVRVIGASQRKKVVFRDVASARSARRAVGSRR